MVEMITTNPIEILIIITVKTTEIVREIQTKLIITLIQITVETINKVVIIIIGHTDLE